MGGDEPAGKAYELGNFLSDTWNRVTRPSIHPDPHSELAEIFDRVRVERIKLLLDDLQARIDPVAIHAVSSHLDEWCERVANGTLPDERGRRRRSRWPRTSPAWSRSSARRSSGARC